MNNHIKSSNFYKTVFSDFDSKIYFKKTSENFSNNSQLDYVWEITTEWMDLNTINYEPSGEILSGLEFLIQNKQEFKLISWYINIVREDFFKNVLKKLKKIKFYEKSHENIIELSRIVSIIEETRNIYFYPLKYLNLSLNLENLFEENFKSLIKFSLLNKKFDEILNNIYSLALVNKKYFDKILTITNILINNGLKLKCFKIFSNIIIKRINEYVYENFFNDLKNSCISKINNWIKFNLYPLIVSYFNNMLPESIESLTLYGMDALFNIRLKKLFDIIIDFPYSIPSLIDLKKCIRNKTQRNELVLSFKNSCFKRLLHAGASTPDIISAYISTIKSFKLLDPRGVLLEKVSKPIRKYLQEKDDTVSTIVNGLLNETSSSSDLDELSKELMQSTVQVENIDDDDFNNISWTPDPIDAPPDYKKALSSDIINSLISLFDNKKVFVREIAIVFANRLLELDNYDVSKMEMKLELLKLRFGESELVNIDVMVKDIIESKRLDTNIHSKIDNNNNNNHFHSSILSRLYWPTFKEEKFNIPQEIKNIMKEYEEAYSEAKPSRNIKWINNMGSVDLTLELDDRKLDFKVSTEQASIIYFFNGNNSQGNLQEISNYIGLSKDSTFKVLSYWIRAGIIKESPPKSENFIILEKSENLEQEIMEDDGLNTAIQSSEEKAAEEMKIFWSYVVGMLTNLGSMPLDRIQSFLKMLVPKETPYTRTTDELRDFLASMIEEGKLDYNSGVYKLRL